MTREHLDARLAQLEAKFDSRLAQLEIPARDQTGPDAEQNSSSARVALFVLLGIALYFKQLRCISSRRTRAKPPSTGKRSPHRIGLPVDHHLAARAPAPPAAACPAPNCVRSRR